MPYALTPMPVRSPSSIIHHPSSILNGLAWWIVVGLLWWAALWRWPSLPGPFGVPDGLLVALLAWVLARPERATSGNAPFWMGAVLGALKDVASSGPVGGWTAIFAATAWVAARSQHLIARDHPVAQLGWVTLFALGTVLAYSALAGVRGEGTLALHLATTFSIPSALTTALSSLGLFPLIRRILTEESLSR